MAASSSPRTTGDSRWDQRLGQLLEFHQRFGHWNVPRGWSENPSLSFWVINQRRQLRHGALPPARAERLDRAGVRWHTAELRTRDRDLHWNILCDQLHAFLRANGHCDIPEGWKENPELARWVVHQRRLKRAGALREDRLRRFEQCGIDWSLEPRRSRTRDRAWDRLFAALKDFRKAHGTCDVPKHWPAHPKLARWVVRQRFMMRHCTIRPDRRTRLEELGFALSPTSPRSVSPPRVRPSSGSRERAWREHYEALSRFRSEHGHTRVTRRYRDNPELARWVSHQRQLRKGGRLSVDRIALLDRLQFPWSGLDDAPSGDSARRLSFRRK
jgi:hypothetical protein